MQVRQRDGETVRQRDTAKKKARASLRSVSLSLCLAVALSLFLTCDFRTSAHKFHFSFTQIEYNAQEKSAEITLRVFADDLEQAISNRSGKAVKLDHKEAAALVAAYLRETFELKGQDGRTKKLTWIGMEPKADVVLLYVEAKIPAGIAGLQLRQRVFFELFEDQVNQVLLKSAGHKASLDFKHGEGFKSLSFGAK